MYQYWPRCKLCERSLWNQMLLFLVIQMWIYENSCSIVTNPPTPVKKTSWTCKRWNFFCYLIGRIVIKCLFFVWVSRGQRGPPPLIFSDSICFFFRIQLFLLVTRVFPQIWNHASLRGVFHPYVHIQKH